MADAPPMGDRDRLVDFVKSVSTCTKFLDFAPEEDLERWPVEASNRIEELEELLGRLSLEAEALLWRMGVGQELFKRGKQ